MPSQSDILRKQHINHPKFNFENMAEGGPVNIYQHCGFVTNKYRESYDQTFGEKDIFKNLSKEKSL